MAFPSTISNLVEPYHGVGGPFVSSLDAVYVVTRNAGGDGIQVFKGVGPIDTWAGAASLTMTSGNTLRSLDVYQVSDTLHIITRDAGAVSTNQIRYHAFSMATDTFTTSNQLVKTNYTLASAIDDSMVGIVVRSAGDKIVLYEGPQVLADIQRSRIYYARHLGAAWSADIALDNGGNSDWYPQEIILGSGNRVHFFFTNYTSNALYQRTLSSANAVESFPAALDSTLPHYADLGRQRGVAYSASAGGTDIRFPYFDTSWPALADARFSSSDTPGSVAVSLSITGSTIAPFGSNIRYCTSLANDGQTIYNAFVNNTTALSFDNAANTGSVTNANTYGLLLTATPGAVLLVFVNTGSGNGTVSAVNVGATQLTRLGAVEYRIGSNMRHEVWGLTSPPSGTLTISAVLANGELTSFVVAAATYTGQRTTATPFGTVVATSAFSTTSSTLNISSTVGNVAVFGFGFEEPNNASVGAGLTNRQLTGGVFPGILIADAPGALVVTGSASRSTATYWGNIGVNLIASATTTRGVYLMSSEDNAAWSAPTLLQAASGIHLWTNCFVRNSARVLAVVFNDGGTIKYTEYSLSVGASASVFTTRLALLGIGR